MCLYAIDRLCLKGILVQKVKIKPMQPGSLVLVSAPMDLARLDFG
ncbi:7869_t:CDS:1, partial [Gigaspora margarita]